MNNVRECYELLGLPPDARPGDVRRAYKRLALALHPDRLPDSDAAREDFCKVTAAYAVLRDAANGKAIDDVAGENRCAICGRARPTRRGRDGRRRCTDCVVRRTALRLPMEPWQTVRGVACMALQAGSAGCTAAAIVLESRGWAVAGLALAIAALGALSHAVMTSVVLCDRRFRSFQYT